MKHIWNKPELERHYNRILEDAKQHGFSDAELASPYLDKLDHQTHSKRILRMIELAYCLGKLKGIAEADEGYTPITLRDDIEKIRPVEGLCCDCADGGEFCGDFSENASCPRQKADGSCWRPYTEQPDRAVDQKRFAHAADVIEKVVMLDYSSPAFVEALTGAVEALHGIAGGKYVELSCKKCVPDGLRDCAGSRDEWFSDEYCRSCRKYISFPSSPEENATVRAIKRVQQQSRARLVMFEKDDAGVKKIGDRIGAILSGNETSVHFLGYGVYVGDEVPPTGFLHDAGAKNPKLQLDNGNVVWGYQCWWGSEGKVKEIIGGRKIINAVINDTEG